MPAARRDTARPPASQPLPEWTYWWIGDVVNSITHGQPIRYDAVPERVARVMDLRGPDGRCPNSRFNRNVPSYDGKASTS